MVDPSATQSASTRRQRQTSDTSSEGQLNSTELIPDLAAEAAWRRRPARQVQQASMSVSAYTTSQRTTQTNSSICESLRGVRAFDSHLSRRLTSQQRSLVSLPAAHSARE